MAGITSSSCVHCLSHPCLWNVYSEQEEKLELGGNGRFRFRAYQTFIRMHHGILGRFHRVQIPQCVLTGIRKLWPDKKNEYIGHRDAKGSNMD
eukprot:scaffold606501_cov145-Attheya_sp.AAC.1